MSQKNLVMVSFGVIVVLFLVTFFLTQTAENNNAIQDYQSGEVSNVLPAEDEEMINPSDKPQAKIDIKVACESALMYTTFIDGAAADAYLTECIEGKHPDVIDRYVESLNMGEGVAI